MQIGSIHERPVHFVMSAGTMQKSLAPGPGRWLHLFASSPAEDIQRERVHPLPTDKGRGILYRYHVAKGFFTDEHDQRIRDPKNPDPQTNLLRVIPAARIGEPRDARATEAGLDIWGVLYEGDSSHRAGCVCHGCRADWWWALAETLERSGSSRRIGASVDGKVIKREPGPDAARNPDGSHATNPDGSLVGPCDVWECWVGDTALTLMPVNPNTYAEIVKSLSAWRDFDDRMQKAGAPQPVATPHPLFTPPTAGDTRLVSRYDGGLGEISREAAVRLLVEAQNIPPELAQRTVEAVFSQHAH